MRGDNADQGVAAFAFQNQWDMQYGDEQQADAVKSQKPQVPPTPEQVGCWHHAYNDGHHDGDYQ
jgi:hypothetical protein